MKTNRAKQAKLSRFILPALFVALLALLVTAVTGEEAEDKAKMNPVNLSPTTFAEIKEGYGTALQLEAKTGVDADTWFIWAANHFLGNQYNEILNEATEQGLEGDAKKAFFEKAEELIYKQQEKLIDVAYECESVGRHNLLTIAELARLSHLKDTKKAYEEIDAIYASKYLKHHGGSSVREALGASLPLLHDYPLPPALFRHIRTVEYGQPMMFLLTDMDIDKMPTPQKNIGKTTLPEQSYSFLTPIAMNKEFTTKNEYGRTGFWKNINGIFHAIPVVVDNFPIPPKRTIYPFGTSFSEWLIQPTWIYNSKYFLQSVYGKNSLDLILPKAEGVFRSRTSTALQAGVDYRGFRVNQKFSFSDGIPSRINGKRLADGLFVELLMKAERPELAFFDSDLRLPGLSKEQRSSQRIINYKRRCDAYLAASYARTIRVTIKNNWEPYASTTYLLPDYSVAPKLTVAYLPRELAAISAYAGIPHVIFNYNQQGRSILSAPNQTEQTPPKGK